MRVIGAVLFASLVACSQTERREPAVAVAPAVVEDAPEPVAEVAPPAEPAFEEITYTAWDGLGPRGCAFMAPVGNTADEIDVVFHFHAGQMSDRELRASGLRAVFVSCGWGVGTAPYSNAFADERRFEWMLKTALRRAGAKRARKIALVSWSAGFASISKILRVPRYYAMVDSVVLLDSLHSAYDARHAPDMRMLDPFVRFARDASSDGGKAMVITHSAIVPRGYASSTEASQAVLAAIDVPIHEADDMRFGRDSMKLDAVADRGNLHLRGYRGTGPHDHFDHLHLVGDVLRTWVLPRWYTRGSEQR